MGIIYRMEEIDFETTLNPEDVMYLTNLYIEKQKEEYEIEGHILYDTEADVENEVKTRAWSISIVDLKVRQRFPDYHIILIIPDTNDGIIYLRNWHGVIYKKINLFTDESIVLDPCGR